MTLFETKKWTMHSGAISFFKIECDVLTDEDIDTIALIISQKFTFSAVFGVPSGGTRLATALVKYLSPTGCKLIVDDVLTTGRSMEEAKTNLDWPDAVGIVVFSRTQCPGWISALFTMWEEI